MKHDYRIIGMSCNGCRTTVEKALNSIDGIKQATVTLPDHAAIEMDNHIATETMQSALTSAGKYSIEMYDHGKPFAVANDESACCGGNGKVHATPSFDASAAGKYYCPMYCEGDKVYDDAGDCPVCGMDLLKVPDLTPQAVQYTCPMHTEIIKDQRGGLPNLWHGFSADAG